MRRDPEGRRFLVLIATGIVLTIGTQLLIGWIVARYVLGCSA